MALVKTLFILTVIVVLIATTLGENRKESYGSTLSTLQGQDSSDSITKDETSNGQIGGSRKQIGIDGSEKNHGRSAGQSVLNSQGSYVSSFNEKRNGQEETGSSRLGGNHAQSNSGQQNDHGSSADGHDSRQNGVTGSGSGQGGTVKQSRLSGFHENQASRSQRAYGSGLDGHNSGQSGSISSHDEYRDPSRSSGIDNHGQSGTGSQVGKSGRFSGQESDNRGQERSESSYGGYKLNRR